MTNQLGHPSILEYHPQENERLLWCLESFHWTKSRVYISTTQHTADLRAMTTMVQNQNALLIIINGLKYNMAWHLARCIIFKMLNAKVSWLCVSVQALGNKETIKQANEYRLKIEHCPLEKAYVICILIFSCHTVMEHKMFISLDCELGKIQERTVLINGLKNQWQHKILMLPDYLTREHFMYNILQK